MFSCPNSDSDYNKEDYLTIKNNSDSNVYIFKKGDTVLYNYPPVENSLILANSEVTGGDRFRSFLSDGSLIYIWLFDQEVVNNNSWEDIVANDMYLIRYDLTLQDLIDLNWEIEYTGE